MERRAKNNRMLSKLSFEYDSLQNSIFDCGTYLVNEMLYFIHHNLPMTLLHYNNFTALSLWLPRWAGTRRDIPPLTPVLMVPVNSYPCQLVPCYIVPKSTRTRDQLIPGQLLPKTNSYLYHVVPKAITLTLTLG